MSSNINEKWSDILSYMKDEFDISDVSYRTGLNPSAYTNRLMTSSM